MGNENCDFKKNKLNIDEYKGHSVKKRKIYSECVNAKSRGIKAVRGGKQCLCKAEGSTRFLRVFIENWINETLK